MVSAFESCCIWYCQGYHWEGKWGCDSWEDGLNSVRCILAVYYSPVDSGVGCHAVGWEQELIKSWLKGPVDEFTLRKVGTECGVERMTFSRSLMSMITAPLTPGTDSRKGKILGCELTIMLDDYQKIWCLSITLFHGSNEDGRNRTSTSVRPLHLSWRCRWEGCPLFTIKELEETALSMKDKKATGPDGFPCEVLKLACKCKSDLLLSVFIACLAAEDFEACVDR